MIDVTDQSPRPIEPMPIPLPYGLQWTDLPDFAADGRCCVSYEIRGLHRTENSRICTLSYMTKAGAVRESTVFIKRTTQNEVRNHHFLAAAGFPIPRLVTWTNNVLVLEFLARVGIRPSDTDEVLRLIARLNAIENTVDAPRGLPGGQHARKVRQALAKLGAGGHIRAYQEIDQEVARLPAALTHGELAFQQMGWAGDRLVFFDLATLGGRARFFDIANVMADLVGLTNRGENELFGVYLGREPTDRDWHEFLLTRASIGFAGLPWRIERGQGVRAIARLTADLRVLGR